MWICRKFRLLRLAAFAVLVGLAGHPAWAFTEETDSGREIDEGFPPRNSAVRTRDLTRAWAVPTEKQIRSFWRNYRPPKRERGLPRKKPKEYVDFDS